MVGPRGNISPYNKRINNGGRVSKQPYGYGSQMTSQQQAAVASAYQQQQGHPGPPAHSRSEAAAITAGGKYGDDLEELGSSRDFVDVVSFRETSMVRYLRYHEWMELVLGTAVDTKKYVNGVKSTTDIEARAKSTYLEKLSKGDEPSVFDKLTESSREKAAFFKKATETLREEFGSLSTATIGESKRSASEEQLEKELQERYGFVIVENTKVKPVRAEMDLPEPLTREAIEAKRSEAIAKVKENAPLQSVAVPPLPVPGSIDQTAVPLDAGLPVSTEASMLPISAGPLGTVPPTSLPLDQIPPTNISGPIVSTQIGVDGVVPMPILPPNSVPLPDGTQPPGPFV